MRWSVLLLALLAGCATQRRSCSNTYLGADWLVVTYRADGEPASCWQLHDTTLSVGPDGEISWESHGRAVFVARHDARVQVTDGNFAAAGQVLGVDIGRCAAGPYLPAAAGPAT